MKRVTVEAHFPELKGRVDFVGTGEATSIPSAIRRALDNIFSETKVKGKRVHTLKLLISVSSVESSTEDPIPRRTKGSSRNH